MQNKTSEFFKQTQFVFVAKIIENSSYERLQELAEYLVENNSHFTDIDCNLYKDTFVKDFFENKKYEGFEGYSDDLVIVEEFVDKDLYEFGFVIKKEYTNDTKTRLIENVFKPLIKSFCERHNDINIEIERSVYIDIYEKVNVTIIN